MKKLFFPMSFFIFFLFMALFLIHGSCCKGKKVVSGNGYALAIGLNSLNPEFYGGWSGDLSGCEADAEDMEAIAREQNLTVDRLLTAQATRVAVLNKLQDLADKLKGDNLLVVSYSGHGGQVQDLNGDEEDGLDETWCLYDGELVDDELHGAWAKFKNGVRILVFSDSCHSGTVLKMKPTDFSSRDLPRARMEELKSNWEELRAMPQPDSERIRSLLEGEPALRQRLKVLQDRKITREAVPVKGKELEVISVPRIIPPQVMLQANAININKYGDIWRNVPKENETDVPASVILISGCEDPQASMDWGINGLFTFMLKKVWNKGEFQGDHLKFHEEIKRRVLEQNSSQSPYYYRVGTPNQEFELQRPYTLKK